MTENADENGKIAKTAAQRRSESMSIDRLNRKKKQQVPEVTAAPLMMENIDEAGSEESKS